MWVGFWGCGLCSLEEFQIWFRKGCLGSWFQILIIKNFEENKEKFPAKFKKKICSGQNFAKKNEI